MTPTIIAIDLTTRVFQFHFVDSDTGAIHSKVLKRAQQQPFFANRRVSRVVMEACGSAHHWARQLAQLGHDVRLIAVQFVRPFRQVDQERCRGRGGNLGSCAASPAARAASTNPSWYMVVKADKIINPELERMYASRCSRDYGRNQRRRPCGA